MRPWTYGDEVDPPRRALSKFTVWRVEGYRGGSQLKEGYGDMKGIKYLEMISGPRCSKISEENVNGKG